jgi:hypothetical protein
MRKSSTEIIIIIMMTTIKPMDPPPQPPLVPPIKRSMIFVLHQSRVKIMVGHDVLFLISKETVCN